MRYAQGMASVDNVSLLGKKVFFLYPHSVIRDAVIDKILEQEYEVYLSKDPQVLKKVLRAYPESLVFINIDEGMPEPEWETWIWDIQNDPETARTEIGILSYNNDAGLQKKYLMDMGIQCGFIRLKLGVEPSIRILLDTLKANEAKGRRKYVRAECDNDPLSSVNVSLHENRFFGTIKDISVVGFSCVFENDPALEKNTLLTNIQLKLRGVLIRTDGIVFGNRKIGDLSVYVILFSMKNDPEIRYKIRRYIQTSLQAVMDSTFKAAAKEEE